MTKQSKNSQRIAAARHFSSMRVRGEKGPSKTIPKHGKNPFNRRPRGVRPTPRANRGEQDKVAAVDGRTVRVFGPTDLHSQRRPFLYAEEFAHRGAALLFAEEFDARQRAGKGA